MTTKIEIENAILESMGNPDTGLIRDNLDTIVDAVLRVVNPTVSTNFKDEKETRIVKANERR